MGLDVLLPVYGLALLDTLSPATIGISVYVLLTARERAARLLFTYLATVAAFYFCLGSALMLGLGAVVDSLGDVLDNRAGYLVQAAIGAALFAASWFVPRKKDADPAGRQERRMSRAHNAPAMIGLGVTTGLLEAATALPYLAAIGIMTSADLPAGQWAPLLAGYNLIMVLPPVLMYVAWRIAGERVRGRFERLRTWLSANSRETLSWVMGIAGFLLLRDAIVVLHSDFGLFG
ncbi:GAP family protein [Jiangella gansuensis]|uniref:GAP family protein n=1 Tax=Jiangella gansuensis TaxID=281473 RepID=UPI0004B34B88|nr:GAP family protein [Jiangella gansuensis]